jgi:Na+/H+-dicarboxylate symporter
MVTIPLVFFTIIYGITSVEHHSGIGKISAKAIIIFLCTAIVAAFIGLATTSIIKPGDGENKTQIVKMISDSNKTGLNTTIYNHLSIIDFLIHKTATFSFFYLERLHFADSKIIII